MAATRHSGRAADDDDRGPDGADRRGGGPADGADRHTEADGRGGREPALETIHRELTTFARRARASARMHPELSLVSFTLLGHLEEQGGCRATDLAAHYALDKSTVSRQVAALERAGLVGRSPDPADQRVQVLHLTQAGTEILARVTERRREAFRRRLADWPEEDLDRFAAYLRRYNAPDPAGPWPDVPDAARAPEASGTPGAREEPEASGTPGEP